MILVVCFCETKSGRLLFVKMFITSFNKFTLYCLVKGPLVSRRHVQNAFDPFILVSNVAVGLCPSAGNLHSPEL